MVILNVFSGFPIHTTTLGSGHLSYAAPILIQRIHYVVKLLISGHLSCAASSLFLSKKISVIAEYFQYRCLYQGSCLNVSIVHYSIYLYMIFFLFSEKFATLSMKQSTAMKSRIQLKVTFQEDSTSTLSTTRVRTVLITEWNEMSFSLKLSI